MPSAPCVSGSCGINRSRHVLNRSRGASRRGNPKTKHKERSLSAEAALTMWSIVRLAFIYQADPSDDLLRQAGQAARRTE